MGKNSLIEVKVKVAKVATFTLSNFHFIMTRLSPTLTYRNVTFMAFEMYLSLLDLSFGQVDVFVTGTVAMTSIER
jgi:hypothetical protein